MRDEMRKAWHQAGTAEICWITPQGPRGMSIVPLVWPQERKPCAAVPLSQLDALDSMPQTAAFSVHSRTPHARTLVAIGRVELRFDLAGEAFVEHLLAQEVAKHPPTRLRADGLMARRENWWWVPRALVTLSETSRVRELPPRAHPGDALLVRDSGSAAGQPLVTVVGADRWPRPDETSWIPLRPRGADPLVGDGEAAFAFGHRHSPDFERWEDWYRSGTMHEAALRSSAGEGAPRAGDECAGDAAPLSLLQRFARHRRVAGACRAGIAAAEQRRS